MKSIVVFFYFIFLISLFTKASADELANYKKLVDQSQVTKIHIQMLQSQKGLFFSPAFQFEVFSELGIFQIDQIDSFPENNSDLQLVESAEELTLLDNRAKTQKKYPFPKDDCQTETSCYLKIATLLKSHGVVVGRNQDYFVVYSSPALLKTKSQILLQDLLAANDQAILDFVYAKGFVAVYKLIFPSEYNPKSPLKNLNATFDGSYEDFLQSYQKYEAELPIKKPEPAAISTAAPTASSNESRPIARLGLTALPSQKAVKQRQIVNLGIGFHGDILPWGFTAGLGIRWSHLVGKTKNDGLLVDIGYKNSSLALELQNEFSLFSDISIEALLRGGFGITSVVELTAENSAAKAVPIKSSWHADFATSVLYQANESGFKIGPEFCFAYEKFLLSGDAIALSDLSAGLRMNFRL